MTASASAGSFAGRTIAFEGTEFNSAHLRALAPDDFVERVVPYLIQGGVLPAEPSKDQLAIVRAAAPLVQERLVVLSDAVGMMGFLFAGEDFAPEPASARVA